MLIKYPSFGSVAANVKYKEKKEFSTAGTDGKVIYYNPEFINKLNENEQVFIWAHEICHIAFNHILRSDGKNQKVWNLATDAVINQFLKKDGLPMVEGGVDIADAINFDSEKLYEKMMKEQQEQQQQGNQGDKSNNQSKNGSGISSDSDQVQQNKDNEQQEQQNDKKNSSNKDDSNQENNEKTKGQDADKEGNPSNNQGNGDPKNDDVGHDTHSLWEDAVKRYKEGKDLDDEDDMNKDESKDSIKDDKLKELQNRLSKLGEKNTFKLNEQIRKEQLEELLDSLSRESKGAGTTTNSEVRDMKDIGTSKPLIDWRLWLREAISMDVDWSYQNAEIDDGVVRPVLEPYPIPETEILLDTSGSINETLLKNFLRECKNILQASRVKVGCFDTKFYGFTEIRALGDIDNLDYVGRGGTDFNTAVNAFTKRVENKIIFTDGDAPMPDTFINAIWVVFGGRKIKPIGGKVIHITDEQLKKLYYSYKFELSKIKRKI